MSYNLTFTTDAMDVCINNYEPHSFDYEGWTVSDKYIYNEKSPRHSNYSLVISSPIIKNDDDLYLFWKIGKSIANMISSIIPHCGLPSLISNGNHDYLTNKSIIIYGSTPNGWKTNYKEIEKDILASKNQGLHANVTFLGVKGYSIMDYSPMKDLEIMMKKFGNIHEESRYLMFLYNSISFHYDSNIFMLMGKALEIIDAMYPIKGKKDKRIDDNFPKLSSIFNGHTIKDLFYLSNRRKETRHYIKDKEKLIPHDSLNGEERILMYKCVTCLITTVIRDQFGLSHPSFEYA